MARYTYRHSYLWNERSTVLEQELAQLTSYLHSSGLDDEFEADDHTYRTDSGDLWIFLPELTEHQLFAITLILSSSQLEFENRPVKFDRPPEIDSELDEDWKDKGPAVSFTLQQLAQLTITWQIR